MSWMPSGKRPKRCLKGSNKSLHIFFIDVPPVHPGGTSDFGEGYRSIFSIFILDKDNKVAYLEYVPELASHPDYDKALAALKRIVG